MADINERLRAAAEAGSEHELKALLGEPGCDTLAADKHDATALMWAAAHGHEVCIGLLLPVSDALGKDKHGTTALMHAARYGHERCVRLLLPASDALAKHKDGWTASTWARNNGHESLAQFIEAYVLAQSERPAIEHAASPGYSRGRAALRV